jgi:hypothetical protein
MMFPHGLTPHQVRELANKAWNGGNPLTKGTENENGTFLWEGIAHLPDGNPIRIGGSARGGVVLHYYPSEYQ